MWGASAKGSEEGTRMDSGEAAERLGRAEGDQQEMKPGVMVDQVGSRNQMQ